MQLLCILFLFSFYIQLKDRTGSHRALHYGEKVDRDNFFPVEYPDDDLVLRKGILISIENPLMIDFSSLNKMSKQTVPTGRQSLIHFF